MNAEENPYVGPRSYRPHEAGKFFGRDREARELKAIIVAHRLVLFHSPSGAGKSSLLNTKVRPALAAAGFELLPIGRVSGFTRGVETTNLYIYNLLLSLHEQKTTPANLAGLSLLEFLDNLVADAAGNYRYHPDHIYPDDAEFRPRILMIDQFEELVTTNTSHFEQRADFFRQLSAAMTHDEQLWVVLIMREDFVARLDRYLHLTPNRLRHRYYMEHLTRAAALEAICRPVADKRPFSPKAAHTLVDNLLQVRTGDSQAAIRYEQFVEPVQLQAVCYQMWEKLRHQPGDQISEADVEQFADVDTALLNFYEETIAKTVRAKSVAELELRTWFDRELITKAGTRNLVFRDEKTTGTLPTEVADYVREQFILGEVVRPGGTWYELIHDRFVPPIMDANQQWLQEQPLIRLAQTWDENGRSDDRLLNGRQLDRLDETSWQALGPLVKAYIEAGRTVQQQVEARKAQQAQEMAQRQAQMAQEARELARQQEKLAQENHALAVASKEQAHTAQKFAAEQIRGRRNLRRALIAIIALFFIALFAAGWVLFTAQAEAGTAQAEAGTAQAQAVTARAEAVTAQVQVTAAQAQAAAAQADATRAAEGVATSLAPLEQERARNEQLSEDYGQLSSAFEAQSEDFANVAATATEAHNLQATLISTLRVTVTPIPTPTATPTPTAPPPFQPSNSQITFSGIVNGVQTLITYRFWGSAVRSGQIDTLPTDGLEPTDPAWSCDGKLAYVQLDAASSQWELVVLDEDGNKYPGLPKDEAVIRRPSWSPDGKTLAFDWGKNGNHDIYTIPIPPPNPVTEATLRPLTESLGHDYHASFAPDGESLVFYSLRDGNRELYLLSSLSSETPQLTRLTNHPADDQRPVWSPHLDTDAQWIAFDSARDGNWEIYVIKPDGTQLTQLTTDSEYDWNAAWSPDGKKIAFLSERTGLGRWQLYVMDFALGTPELNLDRLTADDQVLQPLRPDWQPRLNSCRSSR